MSNWSSEKEAREYIKGLVGDYYRDFKKEDQNKPFKPGDR